MAKVKIETNIEYGKKYRDKNSGFEGIAVSIVKWQYGCVRVGLQAKIKSDGTIPEVAYFDEGLLENVEPVKKERGGPTPNPKQNPNPH